MNNSVILLKNGDFTAKINAKLGANLISLRNDKLGAILLREPDYSKPLDNPYLYGMPILFPVNRISGGEFTFEGRKYKFPINEESTNCHLHGELHKTEFAVDELGDNFAKLSYVATKNKPYLNFTHEFTLKLNYNLTNNGIEIETIIENNSNLNMPIMLGFHTTFNSAFLGNNDVKVKVDFNNEYERNMQNYLPTGNLILDDSDSALLKIGEFNPYSKPISKHFESSSSMVIYDKQSDYSVVYTNDDKYKFRLIYNGTANEYICLEPQNCLANCLNSQVDLSKTGFIYAKPNEVLHFYSKIELLKGDKR